MKYLISFLLLSSMAFGEIYPKNKIVDEDPIYYITDDILDDIFNENEFAKNQAKMKFISLASCYVSLKIREISHVKFRSVFDKDMESVGCSFEFNMEDLKKKDRKKIVRALDIFSLRFAQKLVDNNIRVCTWPEYGKDSLLYGNRFGLYAWCEF